jgi:hypothetical protein
MRLDETADAFRPRLEVLIISSSQHVGMRNILDPCIYISSGHVAKLFASNNLKLFLQTDASRSRRSRSHGTLLV